MADSDLKPKVKRAQMGLFDADPAMEPEANTGTVSKSRPKYRQGQTYQVPVDEVNANPGQPRSHFGLE